MLVEKLDEIYALIEKLMWEEISFQTLVPGVHALAFLCRAWVEQQLPEPAWQSCSCNPIRLNRSRPLGLVLAGELGLEAGPPMSLLEQHKLPSVASGESPYSHILDPRWAAVSLSYLRDQFPSKRKNLGRAYPKKETQTVRLAGAPKPDQRQRGRPSLLHDWAG